ncbi:hypothetical protein FRC07_002985 [Ceratobasidium sp. 392]|nr:hypothetical protein FRC07_002985 [Ceratobasidium sp. 392]
MNIYCLGLFRVHVDQIKYHCDQRPQDEGWVADLRGKMVEGLERSQYPIKAILDRDLDWDSSPGPSLAADGSASLPEALSVRVFDGQHRIEALRGLPMEADDKWWLATVYRSALEENCPAVLYTMMHLGNEQEVKKPHDEVDQFQLVHRLRRLRETGRLSVEEYKESAERIMGLPHTSARQAIPALVRSKAVSEKIVDMLSFPPIRKQFRLSSWKRLVTGRMYNVCTPVSSYPQGHSALITSPFACAAVLGYSLVPADFMDTGGVLSTDVAPERRYYASGQSIKRQDHPWEALEGGSEAALQRVQHRPDRNHALNPLDDMGNKLWTFRNHILLPQVLTSNVVESELIRMNGLCQHLVHIIAGAGSVKHYASKQARDDEACSPVGYILDVLGERALRPDGTASNFPDRVLAFMWRHRDALIQDSQSEELPVPLEAKCEQYASLVAGSQVWWELLRLFKSRLFPKGLPISVPKEFPNRRASLLDGLPGSSGQVVEHVEQEVLHWLLQQQALLEPEGCPPLKGVMQGVSGGQQEDNVGISGQQAGVDQQAHLVQEKEAAGEDPASALDQDPPEEGSSRQSTRSASQQRLGAQESRSESSGQAPPLGQQNPRKRRRNRSPVGPAEDEMEEEEEEEEREERQNQEALALSGPGSQRDGVFVYGSGVYCHRGLNNSLAQLSHKTQNLERREANTIAELLKALVELPSSRILAEVAGQLACRVPQLSRRAMKREAMSYEDEEDGGEDAGDGGQEKQPNGASGDLEMEEVDPDEAEVDAEVDGLV